MIGEAVHAPFTNAQPLVAPHTCSSVAFAQAGVEVGEQPGTGNGSGDTVTARQPPFVPNAQPWVAAQT
jgi:hypothetical protein